MSYEVRASIVMLSRHHPEMLMACLESIEQTVSRDLEYEIILLLNGADPDVIDATSGLSGRTRLVTSNVNLGFPGGCNRASEFARGQYLVFLNDDTIVYKGWLESLIETADRIPDAGAVGSLVLNPDSSIQEAGAIVWSDGVTTSIDGGCDIASANYYFLRDADYCSACSLLVRRSTWEAVGGMDEEFFPGYYEDVDLCFKIQAAGQRVIFDPGSALLHFRSASTEVDFKMFLVRNHVAILNRKWSQLIASHEDPDPQSPIAIERAIHRARGYPVRILIAGLDTADDLEALAEPGLWAAISVSLPGDTGEDRIRLGRMGIKLVWEELSEHLCRPEVTYDFVITPDRSGSDPTSTLLSENLPDARMIRFSGDTSISRSTILGQLIESLRAETPHRQ